MFGDEFSFGRVKEVMEDVLHALDLELYDKRPSVVLVETVLGTIVAGLVVMMVLYAWKHLSIQEMVQVSFDLLRCLPSVEKRIEREKEKMSREVAASIRAALPDVFPILSLPASGCERDAVVKRLLEREKRDVQVSQGGSKVSGTVYLQGEDLEGLLKEVYGMFSVTNPLHVDVFPSVRLMEAEVVSMAASILGGGTGGVASVCGGMTSGGTESILMAVKASRDFMRKKKRIREPHMIIAQSAHAAYWKAAEYFGIKLSVLPVDKYFQLNPDHVAKELRSNTVLVVASAYGFPHGIIDPIPDIAKVTRARNILLHVDSCLGGFVLPFVPKFNRSIPAYDFSVHGVTSMSVDTHKYGMAHKGTSIVLYRSHELRRFQYTSISDWTGGLYISPGLAGSRSGALIATAWASLMYHGMEGYQAITDSIIMAADRFKAGIQTSLPQLEVIGEPQGSVVAFKSKDEQINIYKVRDLMLKKGWHLVSLQFPPALHMCFTGRHKEVVDELLKDLGDCVADLEKDPNCVQNGTAAIYGATCSLSDRRIVGELLATYQDAMLNP